MSFYCPHFDEPNDGCLRLKTDCVPGRRGCVLRGKVRFLVDPDERVEQRRQERGVGRMRSGATTRGNG